VPSNWGVQREGKPGLARREAKTPAPSNTENRGNRERSADKPTTQHASRPGPARIIPESGGGVAPAQVQPNAEPREQPELSEDRERKKKANQFTLGPVLTNSMWSHFEKVGRQQNFTRGDTVLAFVSAHRDGVVDYYVDHAAGYQPAQGRGRKADFPLEGGITRNVGLNPRQKETFDALKAEIVSAASQRTGETVRVTNRGVIAAAVTVGLNLPQTRYEVPGLPGNLSRNTDSIVLRDSANPPTAEPARPSGRDLPSVATGSQVGGQTNNVDAVLRGVQ
jgi:hypothetical protein